MLLKRFLQSLTGRNADPARSAETPRFALVLIRPKHRVHMSVFREVVEVVHAGLSRLGYVAGIVEHQFVQNACNVIFGSHTLSYQSVGLIPANAILYNFEQIEPRLDTLQFFLKELAPRFNIWDYSRYNVAQLAALGCRDNVRFVPLGYTPELTRIASADEQDIDVFFSGAMSPRRESAIEALRAKGLNVLCVSDVYGEERDRLIARAKVVLNLHYHENTRVFEVPRVFYLLANGKAVVTEHDAALDVEADLLDAVVAAPYERVADACRDLVDDPQRRAALGKAGMQCMLARNEVEILRPALADTLNLA